MINSTACECMIGHPKRKMGNEWKQKGGRREGEMCEGGEVSYRMRGERGCGREGERV